MLGKVLGRFVHGNDELVAFLPGDEALMGCHGPEYPIVGRKPHQFLAAIILSPPFAAAVSRRPFAALRRRSTFQPRDASAKSRRPHDSPRRPRHVAGVAAYGGRGPRTSARYRGPFAYRHPTARGRAGPAHRETHREGRGRGHPTG